MDKTAELILDGKSYKLPIIEGSEGERSVDISSLRNQTGYITLDDGYGNTGSCQSQITFIDGEQGILRYRGIPIEELAEKSTFIEVAHLLIFGKLPNSAELRRFSDLLTANELLNEAVKYHFEGFPPNAHPMAILSAMINASSCFFPELLTSEMRDSFVVQAARLLSKVRTIAAFAYRKSRGLPAIYPKPDLKYTANFLHMMFSIPNKWFEPDPEVVQALNLFLMLHADHEQNCSTSTVRMVASSGANLFASCAAGVCALWGPLHGGANMAVIEQLKRIAKAGITVPQLVEKVKKKEEKLFGFGHRVYKSYDPRAHILRDHTDKVLTKLGIKDPLLDIARELEEVALKDDYFKSRDLYPNVDFYSGILLRAIRIPVDMYTVMFAIGRLPGWIAHWKEVRDQGSRIYRPRQVYVGSPIRDYVLMNQR